MITKAVFLRIKELSTLGVTARKISSQVGITHTQVGRYIKMDEVEFDRIFAKYKQTRIDYEIYRAAIVDILEKYPAAKPSAIANNLQMEFPDFNYNAYAFPRYLKRLREEQGILLPEKNGKHKDDIHHSLRETPPPGYEAEVDFGEIIMKDMYGKNRKIYIFTMVFTFSNLLFACCNYEHFTSATAVKAHRRAFEFFGGRTKTILYDNDAVFNNGHNFGDPVLTADFEAFINEIGFGPRFCKPRQPGSKGTIEVGVKSIKTFLEARIYSGIDSLNSELLEWLDSVQNARMSEAKGITAHEAFREEVPALIKVPKYHIEQTIFAACADNVVRYKHNSYELPIYKAFKGSRIAVIDEGKTLAFTMADTGEFLCRHPKCSEQGRRIALPDRDPTDGRSSIESLKLRFRGNEVVEQFCEMGKHVNPKYIVTLCLRVRMLSKYVPDDVIFDGMNWCMEHTVFTVKEFASYLEYRNYGYFNVKIGEKGRGRFQKRASEIKEEIEHG